MGTLLKGKEPGSFAQNMSFIYIGEMNERMNECMHAHRTQPTHEDPALKSRTQISRDLLLLEIIFRLMVPAVASGSLPQAQATGVIGLVEKRFSLGIVKVTLPNEKQRGDEIQEISPVGNTLVKETDK